jgi:hypothetical protein
MVTTGSVILASICPGYDIPDGATRKLADINGADFDGLVPAISAAMSAQLNPKYERAELIPDVTRVVRMMFLEMNEDFDRGRPKACKKWGDILTPAGVLIRK